MKLSASVVAEGKRMSVPKTKSGKVICVSASAKIQSQRESVLSGVTGKCGTAPSVNVCVPTH